LASSACAMALTCAPLAASCSKDIFDVTVNLGAQIYSANVGQQSGTVPTVTCDPAAPTTCTGGQAVEAARAGADAWVATDQGANELENVIRGVCEGRPWFPPDMFGAILRALRDDVTRAREHGDPLDMLSPREREVMASMAEGKRGRQIAEELLISTDTVRTHIRSILSKLDVHSSLEAITIARSAGLMPAAPAGGRPWRHSQSRQPERGRR